MISNLISYKTYMCIVNFCTMFHLTRPKRARSARADEEVGRCSPLQFVGTVLEIQATGPFLPKKYPKAIKIYPKKTKLIVLKNHANYSTHKLPHRKSLPCQPISELVCGTDIAICSTHSVGPPFLQTTHMYPTTYLV